MADASREGGKMEPAGRPADPSQEATFVVTEDGERRIVEEAVLTSAFDPGADRFGELGELGRGGMGRVIDVFDRMLSRRVAIKQVLATDRMALARFEREARITARLEHPGIVPVYEAGRNPDGTPYYIMRRIDGAPLRDAVKRASIAERLACVPNVLAACDAVAYAHARSIIHRDIKPTNILLGSFGETLVIDWGLADVLHEPGEPMPAAARGDHGLTLVGQIMGTPGFMAPEQARGGAVDARADVFALGATLFYVLAGTPPYVGASAQEIVSRVAADSPPDWSGLPGSVPADLRTILGRALAVAADDRYPDAGALAADLRAFVTGNLVAAHHYRWFERFRRWVRRHRAIVALSALSLAAIAVVTTFAFRRVVAERDAAERARQREAERADEITLAQARALLESNPTFAVATVAPLVERGRWREAHNIVSAARARGVAWRLPASPRTLELQLSPDGMYGGSCGTDGVIRIYDLRARAVHTTVELGGEIDSSRHVHLRLIGETSFAVFDRRTLTIHGSTDQRRVEIAAPATEVVTAAGALYWIDIEKQVWRLARDGTAPAPIALDEPAHCLAVSPDGSQLALGGKKAGWLVDAAGATPAQRISDRPFFAIAWDPYDKRVFIAARDLQTVVVDTGNTPPTVTTLGSLKGRIWRQGHGSLEQVIAMKGAYYVMTEGWFQTAFGTKHYSDTDGIGLATARDEIVAAATANGRIALQLDRRTHELPAPGPLERIAGGSTGSFLLGVGGPDVWLWNLDDVAPRLAASAGLDPITLGPHHVLTRSTSESTWTDLVTGATAPGPMQTARTKPGITLIGRSHGDRVLAIIDKVARVLRLNTTDDTEVAKAVKAGSWLTDGRLLLTFDDDRMAIIDPATRRQVPLHVPDGRTVSGIAVAGTFIAIRLDDRTCVRIDLRSDARTETQCSRKGRRIHLATDGTLWFVHGAQLYAWRVDGRVHVQLALPQEILALFVIDDSHLVLDTSTAGYLADLEWPAMARPTIRLGTVKFPIRLGTVKFPDDDLHILDATGDSNGIIAISGSRGGATILDGVTGAWWRVGQDGSDQATTRLSEDGTVLHEERQGLGLWTLPIDPPRDVAATTRLIESLTNVTPEELAPRQR